MEKELNEEYKMRFARIAASFRTKYPMVSHDDMVDLMKDVITIYSEILDGDLRRIVPNRGKDSRDYNV